MDFGDISPGGGDLAKRLPDGHRQIHQTISEIPSLEKIDQWKEELSWEEISLIEQKCKKYFIEFGFRVSSVKKNHLGIACKMIYYTLIYRANRLIQMLVFHIKRIFSYFRDDNH